MSLLTKLGLLGLLGIVALIIIYIIKPNFQQKFISTTFVWRLSLKRKKKKIPISKLRNILLIICQILILTLCTAILTTPVKVLKEDPDHEELVLILDSSASMRAETDKETRFERALAQITAKVKETTAKGGVVSVVLANEKPTFLAQRVNAETKGELLETLKALEDEDACSYNSSDIDSAVTMCSELLDTNPNLKFLVYTDNSYYYYNKDMITVVPMGIETEWNAAILNASSEFVDGSYEITVEIATYGVDKVIDLRMEVVDANVSKTEPDGFDFSSEASVNCAADRPQTIVFTSRTDVEDTDTVTYVRLDDTEKIFNYKSISLSILHDAEGDSFVEDDTFFVFGGQKPTVDIMYYSARPNNFFNTILPVLQNSFSSDWNITYDEINAKAGQTPDPDKTYDIYIYEHIVPEELPQDGIVMLVNPMEAPRDPINNRPIFTVGRDNHAKKDLFFEGDSGHPIVENLIIDNITVSRYTEIRTSDEFETLMSCDGYPMLLLKDNEEQKILVMPFSLHYSNLSMLAEFPMMMSNIFKFFFPVTVEDHAFEVGAEISMVGRGKQLDVSGAGLEEVLSFTTYPAMMTASLPGKYTISQTTYFGKELSEDIYVKIPSKESNIWLQEDGIVNIYSTQEKGDYYQDLLLYLALILVLLLFAEWYLHSRDNI